ncbi:unnamed protein product [Clonostachys solani]|uniref:Uncharacterized protein n=1 Tax=Clonostachys solani TaxID=160281 RepID=A0A9N9Z2G7_9HYPO|nr:unnamed protein product [Clonostachys solani]
MTIINTLRQYIKEAGFGTEGLDHITVVDLNGVEVGSITTLKASAVEFQKSQLFLTMDTGGGPTDFALMRIISTEFEFPKISRSLRSQESGGKLFPPDPVRMPRSHHFKNLGHRFGGKINYAQQDIRTQVDGVSYAFSHQGLGIQNGRMVFSRIVDKNSEEIQSLLQDYMFLAGGLSSSVYVR